MTKPGFIVLTTLATLVFSGGIRSAHATPSICDADLGNLVQNCGFEGGTQLPDAPDPQYVGSPYQINGAPDGWTKVGDWGTPWNWVLGTAVFIPANPDYGPHSGSNALGLGNYPAEGLAGVAQSITDTSGAIYRLSFWVRQTLTNVPATNAPGEQIFQVSWNGNILFAEDGLTGPNPWTQHSYDVTATGLDVLRLVGFEVWGETLVDDVQLNFVSGPPTNAPEPASLALFGVAFGCCALVRRIRHRRVLLR